MTTRWFLLYGGSSADGAGPGGYIGRTEDPEAVKSHLAKIEADLYSTGYVVIVTDSDMRAVRTLKGFK